MLRPEPGLIGNSLKEQSATNSKLLLKYLNHRHWTEHEGIFICLMFLLCNNDLLFVFSGFSCYSPGTGCRISAGSHSEQ